MLSTADILSVLSDDKALVLFNTIALAKTYDPDAVIKKMGITQSQYHSRIRKINKLGLVKRESGNYTTTTLGNMVYEAVSLVDKALKYYWALKTIESFQSSSSYSVENKSKLIASLIDDNQLRKLLTDSATVPAPKTSASSSNSLSSSEAHA